MSVKGTLTMQVFACGAVLRNTAKAKRHMCLMYTWSQQYIKEQNSYMGPHVMM